MHIERRVLHVVADVIGIGTGVRLPLLDRARRSRMGACVIDRLTGFQQLNRAIDALGFVRRLRIDANGQKQARENRT